MKNDVSKATLATVHERHGGMCAVCGRRCTQADVWRHSMSGRPDDPADFSLLCANCRGFNLAKGVRPARYLFRFPPGPPALSILKAAWRWVFLGTGAAVYAAFVAIAAATVWAGHDGTPFWTIGCLLLACLLFTIAGNAALVLSGRGHLVGSRREVVYVEHVR